MFHPQMTSMTEGFSIIGGLQFRAWKGMVADLWEVSGSTGAGGEYQSPYPRLFVLLDGSGANAISIGTESRAASGAVPQGRLSYIPAGLRTYSHVPVGTRLKHLDLHFDAAAMGERFGGALDAGRLMLPRLMFDDARLLQLAHLLADDCSGPGLNDLYGEGIALSLLTALFEVPRDLPRQGQLSARRVRLAMDFIEANCLRTIRLEEVAGLVGLSQAYFSTAFKASTGMAPHQWQIQARIERIKLMLVGGASLTEAAISGGFADQAHMTRTFKRHAGTTPAAWLRSQIGRA